MGRIAGDGSDIVLVNGRQVHYQGIGNLKKDKTTADAVAATAQDGYKKYFLESADKKDRILVYGDRLDFSFDAKNSVPQVMVNGAAYNMVASDNQDSGWFEGFMSGARGGISQAGAATIDAAKQVISQVGVAGTLMVGAGAAFVLTKGVTASVLTGTITALAIPALKLIGAVVLIGVVVAGVAGGIKGAMDAANKKKDSKAIASVVDAASEGENPEPKQTAPLPENPAPAAGEPTGQVIPVVPGTPTSVSGTPGAPYHVSGNRAARRLGTALKELEALKR